MFLGYKQKFLFRCTTCHMILSVDFDEEEDITNAKEDKIYLECACGGKCEALRN